MHSKDADGMANIEDTVCYDPLVPIFENLYMDFRMISCISLEKNMLLFLGTA